MQIFHRFETKTTAARFPQIAVISKRCRTGLQLSGEALQGCLARRMKEILLIQINRLVYTGIFSVLTQKCFVTMFLLRCACLNSLCSTNSQGCVHGLHPPNPHQFWAKSIDP